MSDINHPWEAEYRPTKIEDVLGTELLIEKFNDFIKTKSIPNLLFVGDPGTGKTTVAKILAKQISGGDYLYISASDRNDVNTIRTDVKDFCYTVGIENLKIIVLDEADFLSTSAQAMLRNTTEEFQEHCRFIMTANYDNKIIEPLKSRFQKFDFKNTKPIDILKRCGKILKDKGVELTDAVKNDLKELVKHFYPDIRSTINNMQKFTNGAVFTFKKEMVGNEVTDQMVSMLCEGKLGTIRKECLLSNYEYPKLYRALYDATNNRKFSDDGTKVGQIITTIANYQYMHSLVIDPEINFMACLYDLFEIIKNKEL